MARKKTASSKIIRLSAENVKRLRAVEIRPDGDAIVTITGKNGAGKTSVLDAIWMALGGEKAIPRKPVREGEDEAVIVLEIGDLTVTRRIKPDRKSSLTVASRDGARYPSPQAMLNELVGGLSFDPLAFARMRSREQREVLREIVGLDTSQIEADRAARYEQRTVSNREVKRLAGELSGVDYHPDAPAEEIRIADLTEELRVAEDAARAHASAVTVVQRGVDELAQIAMTNEGLGGQIEEAEELLFEMRERLRSSVEEHLPARQAVQNEARAKVEELHAAIPDRAEIRERLEGAESVNSQVRDNVRRAELEGRRAKAEKTSKGLTARVKKLDAQKAAAISGADYPLEGLSVDDEGVLLDGLPLEQASSAEQLRCSIAIGLALNPQLRVLLVRDGSLLDADSMRLLSEAAAAADAQVWIEVVGDGADGVGIVIEDGAVAG